MEYLRHVGGFRHVRFWYVGRVVIDRSRRIFRRFRFFRLGFFRFFFQFQYGWCARCSRYACCVRCAGLLVVLVIVVVRVVRLTYIVSTRIEALGVVWILVVWILVVWILVVPIILSCVFVCDVHTDVHIVFVTLFTLFASFVNTDLDHFLMVVFRRFWFLYLSRYLCHCG